jgi:hydrogenase expression/formation protein HypE
VVPRGKADKLFINTSGVGMLYDGADVSGNRARPGDRIILSGTMADHGIAVLTAREGLIFEGDLKTDSAPLNHMVRAVLSSGCEVHVLRDPTRGGVGTTLNEIAGQSQVGMTLFEKDLPVKKQVRGVCELLGFDPLYLANEGKLIAVVPEKHVRQVLDIIRADEFGGDAVVIGEVTDQNPGKVFLRTAIGGRRLVDMLTGEQLPRIC